MLYKKFPPPAALADVVRFFWILEGVADSASPLLYRVFADGCPGLLVQYGARFHDVAADGSLAPVPVCFVHGQSNDHNETTVAGRFGLIGVYFFPYAVRLLQPVSARELTNLTLDASYLLGADVRELEDRVLSAATARERIAVLSEFLLVRLGRTGAFRDRGMEASVRRVLALRGGVRVDSLAENMGVSARQFERKFIAATGLPPKLFARIIRFQGTLTTAASGRVTSLTDLAYASGYSDQSHFIRDFREFAGMNPRQYFVHLDNTAESFVPVSAPADREE